MLRTGRGGRRRLALACTAAMAFAGCGAAADEERERSDSERATAALVRQADLPADWTRIEVDGTSPSDEELKRLCPGYPASWFATDGDAIASFESDAGAITHGVSTVADAATAEAQFDSIEDPRGRSCMRAIVGWSLRSAGEETGVELKAADVGVEPLRRGSEEERGLHLTMTLAAPDGSVELPMEADMVATREGTTFSTLMVMGVAQPVDAALRDRLAELAGERLRKNFG